MILKSGVRVLGMRPELILALIVAETVFNEEDVELVITSAIDGKHSRGSLHYVGAAVDLRTRQLSKEAVIRVQNRLAASLGLDYDVVLEKTHLHVEFQPKEAY